MSRQKIKDPDTEHAVAPRREREWALGKADPVQAVLALPMDEFQAHLDQALDARRLRDAHAKLEAIRRYAELERQEDALKLDITEKLLRVARRIGELVPAGDAAEEIASPDPETVPAGTDTPQAVVTKQRLAEWRTFASVPVEKWEEQLRRAKEAGKLSARRLLEVFGRPKESTKAKTPRVGPPAKKVEEKPEKPAERHCGNCGAILAGWIEGGYCVPCQRAKAEQKEAKQRARDEDVDPVEHIPRAPVEPAPADTRETLTPDQALPIAQALQESIQAVVACREQLEAALSVSQLTAKKVRPHPWLEGVLRAEGDALHAVAAHQRRLIEALDSGQRYGLVKFRAESEAS